MSEKIHPTYTIQNLTKSYNNAEVLNIDHLELHKGTTVGLVGNNGAGKTTLMRCMLDLIRPTTGQILFEGNNYSEECAKEAEKRGLKNLKTTPEALKVMTTSAATNTLMAS